MVDATDRNIYILGAGFSSSERARLIHGFLDRPREYLDDHSSGFDLQDRGQSRS